MNLEGLEMIAVLIVIVLFVKVLEQFGLIEAGLEGKGVLFSGLSFLCSCHPFAARQRAPVNWV